MQLLHRTPLVLSETVRNKKKMAIWQRIWPFEMSKNVILDCGGAKIPDFRE